MAEAAAVAPLAGLAHLFPPQASGARAGTRPGTPAGPEAPKPFSPQDDAFLQELEAANFRYFWEQANPETGIVTGPLQRAHSRTKAIWEASPQPDSG